MSTIAPLSSGWIVRRDQYRTHQVHLDHLRITSTVVSAEVTEVQCSSRRRRPVGDLAELFAASQLVHCCCRRRWNRPTSTWMRPRGRGGGRLAALRLARAAPGRDRPGRGRAWWRPISLPPATTVSTGHRGFGQRQGRRSADRSPRRRWSPGGEGRVAGVRSKNGARRDVCRATRKVSLVAVDDRLVTYRDDDASLASPSPRPRREHVVVTSSYGGSSGSPSRRCRADRNHREMAGIGGARPACHDLLARFCWC